MLLRWSLHNISGSSRSELSLCNTDIFDTIVKGNKRKQHTVSHSFIWFENPQNDSVCEWGEGLPPTPLSCRPPSPTLSQVIIFDSRSNGMAYPFFRGLWVLARTLLSLPTPYLRRLPVLCLLQGEIMWGESVFHLMGGKNQTMLETQKLTFQGEKKQGKEQSSCTPFPSGG